MQLWRLLKQINLVKNVYGVGLVGSGHDHIVFFNVEFPHWTDVIQKWAKEDSRSFDMALTDQGKM